jgi:hypothetical protein
MVDSQVKLAKPRVNGIRGSFTDTWTPRGIETEAFVRCYLYPSYIDHDFLFCSLLFRYFSLSLIAHHSSSVRNRFYHEKYTIPIAILHRPYLS